MVLETRQLDRRSAAQLRVIESRVIRLEETEAWRRVRRLGQITSTSAIVDRPDWAEQAGLELQHIAARQLRMLDETGRHGA